LGWKLLNRTPFVTVPDEQTKSQPLKGWLLV
jgi:hypothetical protein